MLVPVQCRLGILPQLLEAARTASTHNVLARPHWSIITRCLRVMAGRQWRGVLASLGSAMRQLSIPPSWRAEATAPVDGALGAEGSGPASWLC